ncbi:MAG TPA: YfhO family protein, partial [Gemmatimonadaceae bacterium]|nr:YfhO family protein [Gemmatimonadaceae bacterium]
VPEVRVIPNTETALSVMKTAGWDPRRIAVVDRPVGLTVSPIPLADSTRITEKSPDRVVVRTSANRPALLVLSDVYAHGWKAWVDDKPTPIAITNIAFRGVPVNAGTHTVRFEFAPEALERGRLMTGFLFLVLIVYGIGYAVAANRRRDEEPETA